MVIAILFTGAGFCGQPLHGQTAPGSQALPAVPINAVRLLVQGGVSTPVELSREDIQKLSRVDERVKDRDGHEVVYSGTPLVEVLRAAGMKLDPSAMPSREAVDSYVLVRARDGYKAIFALAEIDPALSSQMILLADTKDGQPLTAAEGPWRIVVAADKRPARWVRQVTTISVNQG